jgi:hypothetical protein
VSLGRIWNPNATPSPDLVFDIRSQNETYSVFMLPSLDGDYFADGVVNQTDYNTWRQYFGSTSVLLADGNINGAVDAADYVVWRKNRGMSIPSSAFASGGGFESPGLSVRARVVPEPSTLVFALLLLSGMAALTGRGRRWR